MANVIGRELPRKVFDYLGGDTKRHRGNVITVLTTDSDGWPHVALLSHWEVFAKDARNIRLATYSSSRTTKNILRTRKVTLMLADRGMTYYVKGAATPRAPAAHNSNRFFNVKVEKVLEDELPGTRITSGIRYVEHGKVEPHEEIRGELQKKWSD